MPISDLIPFLELKSQQVIELLLLVVVLENVGLDMVLHDKVSHSFLLAPSPLDLFFNFSVFYQTIVQTFSIVYARFLVDQHLTSGILLQSCLTLQGSIYFPLYSEFFQHLWLKGLETITLAQSPLLICQLVALELRHYPILLQLR
jgi:hypothetical protein